MRKGLVVAGVKFHGKYGTLCVNLVCFKSYFRLFFPGLMKGSTKMLNNQNTFQNAGQNGSFYYQSIGNPSINVILLFLVFSLLLLLLRSEEHYRRLLESK